MKNIYIFLLLIVFFNMSISCANAYTGECVRTGGTAIVTSDINDFDVTATTDNYAGKIVVDGYRFVAAGTPYYATCDIPKNEKTNVYISTTVPLQPKGDNWYVINDYLSIKTETYIGGNRGVYLVNPVTSEPNKYDENNGNETLWHTGGSGKLSLRIDKKFIGISPFNVLAVIGYANAYAKGKSSTPLYMLYIKGAITVPQSCELDAGTTITMDFGNIGATLFSQAGAGNKPAGVNPQTHTVAVKCKNIGAQPLLSMRIEADSVSGNAMVSDNKDVGFVVAGSDNVPLTPNNINSKIKFQLDDNSAAMVPITAWPVSVTGNKPAEGKFTSEGYLRIDFD